jgi:hypothetical protein
MSSTKFNLDQVTLEYFTNRNTYNKFLAKNDSQVGHNLLYKSAQMNKESLLKLLSQIIDEPSNESFRHILPKYHTFIEECIGFVEKQEDIESSDSEKQEESESSDSEKQEESESSDGEKKQATITTIMRNNKVKKCENVNIQPKTPIEFWKSQQVLKHSL